MGALNPPGGINREHWLYNRGLAFALAPGARGYPAFVRRGAIATATHSSTARSSAGHAGVGLGAASGGYWGGSSANNTFTLNQNEGTVLVHFQTNFSPTDSIAHMLFCNGPDNYPTGPTFDIIKYSDNNWYAGWWTGSDTRASVSASGTFTSGVPTTLAVTWNKTTGLVGTKLYTGGILRATNATSPATGSTSGSTFLLGIAENLTTFPFFQGGGGVIYSLFILDKALLPEEIIEHNAFPNGLFRSTPRVGATRVFAGGVSVDAAVDGGTGSTPVTGGAGSVSSGVGLDGGGGSASVTGGAGGVSADAGISGGAGSATTSGEAGGVSTGADAGGGAGSAAVTGQAGGASSGASLDGGAGSAAITGGAGQVATAGGLLLRISPIVGAGRMPIIGQAIVPIIGWRPPPIIVETP